MVLICRRCGEPDRRGSARERRARRAWLLSEESGWGGDGEKVPCWNSHNCGTILTNETMEIDRILPGWECAHCDLPAKGHAVSDHAFAGGTYRRDNIRPSCVEDNRARNAGNPWKREEWPCVTG